MTIYPVILCGGSGKRLWPASRPEAPKQFLRLVGDHSLFQSTMTRLTRLKRAGRPIVVAGASHAVAIAAQLDFIGISATVLLEPEGRDSAAAMAAAAAWVANFDPKGTLAILAADHHVPDAAAFCAAIELAAKAAGEGWIVTFGVRPSSAATAYGYINPANALRGHPAVRNVAAFVEKPDRPTAIGYVREGYLWNSGNFVATAEALLGQLDTHAPEIAAASRAAVASSRSAGTSCWMLGPEFASAPKISIDYAVMEKTDRAAVAPVDFDWSDLGAWDAVHEASAQDQRGNSAIGPVVLSQTNGCLIRAPEGMTVTVAGLKGFAVIAQRDAVLICDLGLSQSVKDLAEMTASAFPQPRQSPASPGEVEGELLHLADRLQSWLSTSALPLWWTLGADHVRGGFHESLDLRARATGAPRRSRVQTRQTHVYAVAGAAGWPGPWRDAVAHGWDGYVSRYERPDGLFRALVGPGGASLDDAPRLYDQAFTLLALASLHKAAPDAALVSRSERLLSAIGQYFGYAEGFREASGTLFQSNPHMHLLEASLAWSELTDRGPWRGFARRLVQLALNRFVDRQAGVLKENFDGAWQPLSGTPGRLVEPGHQFEWAWLLHRWSTLSRDPVAEDVAEALAAAGCRGIDPVRGVALDELFDDFRPSRTTARLWPQTEWLRTAATFAAVSDAGKAAAWRESALRASKAVSQYLDAAPMGLWRDVLSPDGDFLPGPAPASSLYHLQGAIHALGGLADFLRAEQPTMHSLQPAG